jgi:polyketide synthase PksN
MKWEESKASGKEPLIPWKDNGKYLITGGAGGLGIIFAREIAEKVKGATLILTGRSPLDKQKEALINTLEELGARALYKQADISNKEATAALLREIINDEGKLDGIIHSAGINQDNFIIKKTEEEFLKVLNPKVAGLVNLDQASKDIRLDFFILFSSVSGGIGNPGQSDYSAANAFMDEFAAYRNELKASEKRYGRTMSVGWPLWKDGGMHVDQETEKLLYERMGVVPIQSVKGIQALYNSWALEKSYVIVVEGEAEKIRRQVIETAHAEEVNPSQTIRETNTEVDRKLLLDRVTYRLKVVFSEITRLDIDRIDPEEQLESYGIDSVMINQLNRKLEDVCKDLSKTLFYEYPTLKGLAEHLTEKYMNECIEWTGLERKPVPIPENSPAVLKIKLLHLLFQNRQGS